MPCDGNYSDIISRQNESAEKAKERETVLVTRLRLVTALLCQVCSKVEGAYEYLLSDPNWPDSDVEALFPAELRKWYDDHKRRDQQRIAAAQRQMKLSAIQQKQKEHLQSVRARLADQLSDDELLALGITKEQLNPEPTTGQEESPEDEQGLGEPVNQN